MPDPIQNAVIQKGKIEPQCYEWDNTQFAVVLSVIGVPAILALNRRHVYVVENATELAIDQIYHPVQAAQLDTAVNKKARSLVHQSAYLKIILGGAAIMGLSIYL
jgi:hypothetical protein